MADRSLQVRCRVLAGLWIAAVIAVSIQASARHNNNFEIFRASWDALVAGRDLYAPSARHQDFFKYTPTFALLFAPVAVLPFWLGLLVWNAVNAGALYWGLGRVLDPEQAFVARALVFFDAVGSMQNVQSNALVAGLMILAFADLDRRKELRAAIAVAVATIIKVFPILAASFAVFRPYRLPRFAVFALAAGIVLLAAPLIVLSPEQLLGQYRSFMAIGKLDALDRGYSVMKQLHLWFGMDGPNWPVQLAGVAILVAPLVRISCWGIARFRLLYLASVLMFCVLFNHKSESPSFVIAVAGVAIWFAVSARDRLAWLVLAVVVVGTVLSSSDLMPVALQRNVFDAYRLKTLPVCLAWVVVQTALWRFQATRQTASTPPPSRLSDRAMPAT
jgi:hypothetical protein